jgi:exoribonuclease-2
MALIGPARRGSFPVCLLIVNVLYEDSGAFKVATVLADSDSTLQVEAPHGKRAKIKSKDVLLRFPEPGAVELLAQAETMAGGIDADFLWQCCGPEEFGFADLAREYCGRAPSAVEAAGILVKLHSAPMYFYRKGRGRYRAAPPETLRVALVGIEKKKQQQLKISLWAEQLERGALPEEFRPLLEQLLYKPDRNRPETKALEEACAKTGMSPAKLIERCGALPSSHDYHLNRFLYEYFPRGTDFPPELGIAEPQALPVAEGDAFSLDDAATTEIDDAFSLAPLAGGRLRVGIHIAAPALGFAPGSALDAVARERLSTVYMPGCKIPMLPPEAIERFSLAEGAERPACSLYFDVRADDFAVESQHTRVERVRIAANLRHQAVEGLDAAFLSDTPREDIPYSRELNTLWKFAGALERGRGKSSSGPERPDYSFRVEGHGENVRVDIAERRRGTPLDKLVAELMIAVNGTWGKLLDDHDVAAIYRAPGPGNQPLCVGELAPAPVRRSGEPVAAPRAPPWAGTTVFTECGHHARRGARFRNDLRRLRRIPAAYGALLVPQVAAAGGDRRCGGRGGARESGEVRWLAALCQSAVAARTCSGHGRRNRSG